MPKHAFPAAGEAVPAANINRRAVLTGVGATAAALAATTIPAEPSVSLLLEIIEAHKRANAHWLEWMEKEDAEHSVARRLDRDEPILAEVLPGYHLEIRDPADIASEIAKRHDERRNKIKGLRLPPDIEATALASIDKDEAEARKRCAAALRKWRQRREAIGYAATKRSLDRAAADDRAAAFAVLSYPCRSVEEYRIRAEYLLHDDREWPGTDIRYGMEGDPLYLAAFIRSTAGMEPEA